MDKLPTPLARRILIKVAKVEERVDDGIIRVETRTEIPQEGVVVMVGQPGDNPFDVKIGDTVIIPGAGHIRVVVKDEEYLLVKESKVLAIKEEI